MATRCLRLSLVLLSLQNEVFIDHPSGTRYGGSAREGGVLSSLKLEREQYVTVRIAASAPA